MVAEHWFAQLCVRKKGAHGQGWGKEQFLVALWSPMGRVGTVCRHHITITYMRNITCLGIHNNQGLRTGS